MIDEETAGVIHVLAVVTEGSRRERATGEVGNAVHDFGDEGPPTRVLVATPSVHVLPKTKVPDRDSPQGAMLNDQDQAGASIAATASSSLQEVVEVIRNACMRERERDQ